MASRDDRIRTHLVHVRPQSFSDRRLNHHSKAGSILTKGHIAFLKGSLAVMKKGFADRINRDLPAIEADDKYDQEDVLILQPADLPKDELITFIEVSTGSKLPSLRRMNKHDLARLFSKLFF